MKTAVQIVLILVATEKCLCSSFSGAGKAVQSCGISNTQYICPTGDVCMSPAPSNNCRPRSQRCTAQDDCNYPNNDDMCFRDPSNPDMYSVRKGHVPLIGVSGFKRSIPDVEHQFIQYRGFTYEFGKSYNVQILDVTDPCYRYRNPKSLNRKGIQVVGSSYCTWEEATILADKWDTKYHWYKHNCQHFSKALAKYLTTGTCAEPPTSFEFQNTTESQINSKQQRIAKLEKEADSILSDCNYGCCKPSSTSFNTFQAHVVVVALVTAIFYVM